MQRRMACPGASWANVYMATTSALLVVANRACAPDRLKFLQGHERVVECLQPRWLMPLSE